MSQYAELEDMVLGLQATALTDVDEDVIIGHIQDASALADSYLAGRGYQLPLTTWGQDLRGAVVRIAAWSLINARGVNPNHAGHIAIMDAAKEAKAWLRDDVASGNASLSMTSTTPARTAHQMMQVFGGETESRGW